MMPVSTSKIQDWQPSTGRLTLKAFGWPDFHPLHDVRDSLAEAGIQHCQVREIIGSVRINRGSGTWPKLSSVSGSVIASGSPFPDALPHLREIVGNLQVADGVILTSVNLVRGDVSIGASCSLPDLKHIVGNLETTSASNLQSLKTVGGRIHAPYTPFPHLLFIGKGGTLGIKSDVPLLEAAGESIWFWQTKSSSKIGVTIGNHANVVTLIKVIRDHDLARLALLDMAQPLEPSSNSDQNVCRTESLGLDL